MATTLYEHLIKPLGIGTTTKEAARDGQVTFTSVPGTMTETIALNGHEHLEGLDLSVTWSVHNGLGNWHGGQGLHVHAYPECHMFVGLDTANVKYLGARIECCLGEEKEPFTFDEPNVVVIPAGLPHGPVTTQRIYSTKGFGCYTVALTKASKSEPYAPTDQAAPDKGSYAHLVKPLKTGLIVERGVFNRERFPEQKKAGHNEPTAGGAMKLGPGNADHLTWMFGKDLAGLDVNMDWGFFSSPGLWHRNVGAHVHPTDEILVFVGTDPTDMGYLGAEIEIDMGKEHERHLIDKPSVVICPAGLPHAPIVTRWIDRPFAFFSVNLSSEPNMAFID